MFFPIYVEKCDQAAHQADQNCASYHIVLVALWKIGEILVDSAFITAVATAFIAYFTYTLYEATKGLVKAAEIQSGDMSRSIEAAEASAAAAQAFAETAQAQVEVMKIGIFDLERAYIAVGVTQINTEFVPHPGKPVYSAGDPVRTTLQLYVHNTGRSAGLIKKLYGEFSRTPPEGDIPIYKDGASKITDFSVGANAEAPLQPYPFVDDFTGKQFFWGYLDYLDIFNRVHTSRFCACIEPGDRRRPGTGKYDIAGSDVWRECD